MVMTSKPRVLLVVNHCSGARNLSTGLDQAFELVSAENPQEALAFLISGTVVDIVLVGSDDCVRVGSGWISRLRTVTDAALILAASCQDGGGCALQAGADDWVPLSVHPRELHLRLTRLAELNHLRRLQKAPVGHNLNFHGWTLMTDRRDLIGPDGQATRLTGAEAGLLSLLVRHAGEPLDRKWLISQTSSRDLDDSSRSIDVTIAQLRRKLGDNPRHPRLILTMHGVGYRFADLSARA